MRLLIIILLFPFLASAQMVGVVGGKSTSAGGGTPADTILINWYGNGSASYSGTNWNNIQSANTTTTGSSLVWASDGSNSGISCSVSGTSAGFIADNGNNYCSSQTTGFPTLTYRYSMYVASNETITFSGLTPSASYTYYHLAARETQSWVTTLTIGASSDGMTNNVCNDYITVNFTADGSGNAAITITTNGSFAYLAAGKLIRNATE